MKTLNLGDWLIKHTERPWTDADGAQRTEMVSKMIKITEVKTNFAEPRYTFETIAIVDVENSPKSNEEHLAATGGFTHSMLERNLPSSYYERV